MNNLTILIPVYNASTVVSRTIDYLIDSGILPENIIIANDASTEKMMLEVESNFKSRGVNWINNPENMGYTRNINNALSKITTEYVLILNSDCFISKHSIDKLLATLKKNTYYGCIGPLSSNAGNQTVKLNREIDWLNLNNDEISSLVKNIEQSLALENGTRPLFSPSINGFCCMWRADALKNIGFFDQDEFPLGYGEEDDACFNLIDYGLIPVVAPWIFAPHIKTQSFTVTQRDSLKEFAMDKLRMKHSNLYMDKVLDFFGKSPYIKSIKNTEITF